jgi:flagellar assembly protein FliH
LSRIIRTFFQQQDEETKTIIPTHSFEKVEFVSDFEEMDATPQITQEQLLQERDQLLAHARQQIAYEQGQLENYRTQQLQAIEELKQLWEEEKRELEHQAYENGFAQGYEAGIQKATADMEQSLSEANETVAGAKDIAQQYIESQETVILELALKAADRILGYTLERDDEQYVAIIKRGLKEAREMKEIKIYVSPEYYKVVSKNYEELAEMFPTDVPFMIFVNEDLNVTDSYIETNNGRIVVSIDSQLNELRLKLREILDSKE